MGFEAGGERGGENLGEGGVEGMDELGRWGGKVGWFLGLVVP